jgi:Icc-related predicted phosphoesterase
VFEARLAKMKGANVVITHSPPFGIMDVVKGNYSRRPDGQQLGSPALARLVRQEQPALHIFGHIHECRGVHREHGITWANVANSGRFGQAIRPATVIDLDRSSGQVVSVVMGME